MDKRDPFDIDESYDDMVMRQYQRKSISPYSKRNKPYLTPRGVNRDKYWKHDEISIQVV